MVLNQLEVCCRAERRGRCAGKSTFSTFAETKDAERTDYILGGAEFGGTKDVQPKGY